MSPDIFCIPNRKKNAASVPECRNNLFYTLHMKLERYNQSILVCLVLRRQAKKKKGFKLNLILELVCISKFELCII